MADEIYRRLRQHLDGYGEGFAPSTTGADVRLLQRLFTPANMEATWRTIGETRGHDFGI